MTPTRTRVRSAVTWFRPDIHHPHLYALLILVVTALMVTLGARPAAPDATATTTDKTFETDDHVITQTQSGTITIIDKKTQIAVQDTVDPAAAGPTEKELAAQTDRLAQQFKKNLGWDLETDADRTRLLHETRALTQQLHNIPPETLDLKENATLRTVRGIFDEMDGTKTCRERCLVPNSMRTVIEFARLALSLGILKSHLARGGPLHTAQAVAAVVLITGQLLVFWLSFERDLHNIPNHLKWLIDISMGGFLLEVTQVFSDMVDYLAHSRTTMRQAVTDAAQHVDTLTPDDEPATDYNLAKDEL